MIKLTATALVYSISPVIEIPPKTQGGQPFAKRELVLDDSWVKENKNYPNFVLVEFTGDKMQMLDNYYPGQCVTVEAFVSGREHQGRYFTSLRGLSIVPYQAPQTGNGTGQYAPAAAAPGGYPQQPGYPQGGYPSPGGYAQQPAYPQQPQYPQQNGYAQPPSPAPMPGTPQGGNLGPDGLPFR